MTKELSYQWRPWKLAAMVLAGLLVAGGGVMSLGGGDESEYPVAGDGAGAASPAASRSFFPGDPTATTTELPKAETAQPALDDPEGPWSPALLRGGLSFFVAFAVAFAFRTFLKIAVFFAGLWVASLFLLSNAGYLTVHWDALNGAFTGWAQTLGAQFKSVTTFLTGSLPSTGMAGLGLFAGLRKS